MAFYDVEGWAFHHNVIAIQKYAPRGFHVVLAPYLRHSDLQISLAAERPDVILLCRFQSAPEVRDEMNRNGSHAKLVSFWNCGWPMHSEKLAAVLEASDLTVFSSEQSWNGADRPAKGVMIPIGVDLTQFRVVVPLHRRTAKVLWTGSLLFRELKGFDRLIKPLGDCLDRQSIPYDFRLVDSFGDDKFTLDEMVAWYNSGTVLVCASELEGTPNVALEAAACGCALVSARVGNMPELIRSGENGYLVERTLSDLFDGTMRAIAGYPALGQALTQDIVGWGWDTRTAALFQNIVRLGVREGGVELYE